VRVRVGTRRDFRRTSIGGGEGCRYFWGLVGSGRFFVPLRFPSLNQRGFYIVPLSVGGVSGGLFPNGFSVVLTFFFPGFRRGSLSF